MTEDTLLKNEREVILKVDPDAYTFRMGTSRKRGRPGIVSNRCQICKPSGDTATQYVNYEEFNGYLSPMVYLLYARKLKAAFEKHNLHLKKICRKFGCIKQTIAEI